MTQDARVQDFVASFERLRAEVHKVIVGHHEIVDQVLSGCSPAATCCWRVPGLGKTLLVRTLAECLDLPDSRGSSSPRT